MKYRFTILLIFVLFFRLQGQVKDSVLHPKIGLVLSGGGAKGLAHIGVLKELERLHIRPDFIAGTSMGAIVGSLYASGYTAEQIDSIFHTLNFNAIMFDEQKRRYKTFFRKQYGQKFILKLPFSLKEMSVQIPKGLADSQSLFNTMAQNLLHTHNIDDFSKLKIPFICISTNIASGEQVLFNKGYLPEAVTASALLPTVYKPMELDHKLLLDGGIVNNYPIKELRDMGADIIIGSDVQGKILSKEQIKDLPAIMDQIISFQMYKEMPLKKVQTDIYIHPNIEGIGLTDFEKKDTIIQRGLVKARQVFSKYKAISKLQSDFELKKIKVQKPDSILFDQITIYGYHNYKRNYILSKIDVQTGVKISYKDLLEGINNLLGTGNYEYVHYRFRKKHGSNSLILKLKEKNDKASMSIGFHYNPLYKINVIGNFERKHLLAKNDLLSVDIIGGALPRFNFNYFADNGFGWNIGWHTGFHRFKTQTQSELFFDNNISVNKLDLNVEQLTNRLSFLGTLNHSVYFRAGLQHIYKRYYTYVFSGLNNQLPYIIGKNHYFGSFIGVFVDSRDDFDFPKKGVNLALKWDYFPLSSDFYDDFHVYSSYHFKVDYYQKLMGNLYIQPSIHSGLLFTKKSKFENQYYLGGDVDFVNFDNLDNVSSLSQFSVRATKYANLTFGLDYILFKKHHLNVSGQELLYDQTDDLLFLNTKSIYGYNISYGYESFLGPFKLNYGYTPELRKSVFSFSFGYIF